MLLATGAAWRRDGIGRSLRSPLPGLDTIPVYSPDDLMQGRLPQGRVLVFDDEHYYMAGVLAEQLARAGCTVHYATPEADASSFTHNTLEQGRIQTLLLQLGVHIHAHRVLCALESGRARCACTYTGREEILAVDAVVLVTERVGEDRLYQELIADAAALARAGIAQVRAIGDAHAPGIIAVAVYSGHLAAREIDGEASTMRRERVAL